MEYTEISGTDIKVSRIGLGTQPIGYFDKDLGMQTIRKALDQGINLMDTAPVYGDGRSEEILGQAMKDYDRGEIIVSSKTGMEKVQGKGVRNTSPELMARTIEASLKRLGTDYIDIFHVHWPDMLQPAEETAGFLKGLKEEGKIRAIGLSNYSSEQMYEFCMHAEVNVCQPPYNVFERAVEVGVLPFCQKNDITLMAYRSLCQGLLTGKMNADADFKDHPVKSSDPKFQLPRYRQYLEAVSSIDALVREDHDRNVLDLAIQWILGHNNTVALWGGWKPEHMEPVNDVFGWKPDPETRDKVRDIVKKTIHNPVGPGFLEPPTR
ncbi:aldo/keto reductase [Methanolobus halotolerans]|uniref:General stress protein n=1 Tax=Methanolobus halotolerans TaxID=2052935 RepID=A0A4E0Q2C7_9EURY|nr:aldo/keto reductase [Methanolobus halotolerans]TGC06784.1 general stress protein [Methanolobus halotolerans]